MLSDRKRSKVNDFVFCSRSDKLASQPSKYETISKKGPKLALGGTDAVIMLRKRVFRHITDIPNDPVEYRLLYAEAVQQVISVSTGTPSLTVDVHCCHSVDTRVYSSKPLSLC